MKIKSIIQVSAMALMLGTVVSFASFDVHASGIVVDRAKHEIKALSLSDAAKVVETIPDVKDINSIDAVVKVGSSVERALTKISPTAVIKTIGNYQHMKFDKNDEFPLFINTVSLVNELHVPPKDEVAAFKFGMSNPKTISTVVSTLKNHGSQIQEIGSTGAHIISEAGGVSGIVDIGSATEQDVENLLNNFNV